MTFYVLTDGRRAVEVGPAGDILTEPYPVADPSAPLSPFVSEANGSTPTAAVSVPRDTFEQMIRGDHVPTLDECRAIAAAGLPFVVRPAADALALAARHCGDAEPHEAHSDAAAQDCPGHEAAPWTDDDTTELAAAMSAADRGRADRWDAATVGARFWRADAIARAQLTDDELAAAAALYGIVADRSALPLNAARRESLSVVRDPRRSDEENDAYAARYRARVMRDEAIARQRETSDLWTVAARHYRHRDTYTESVRVGPDRAYAAAVLRGEALALAESLAVDAMAAALDTGRAQRWPILAAGIAAAAR